MTRPLPGNPVSATVASSTAGGAPRGRLITTALGRYTLGFLILLNAAAAMGSLSRAPWTPPDATRAVIRLSWRAVSHRTEECRPLTEGERQRLPAHMQQDEVCDGRVSPFVLRMRIDDVTVADDTIHAAGARGDRPVYVLREYQLEPGDRVVRVEFERLDNHDVEEEEEEEERERDTFPAALTLSSRVTAVPGRVLLITYDADSRALVMRSSSN